MSLACTLVIGITLACFIYVLPHVSAPICSGLPHRGSAEQTCLRLQLIQTHSWPYVLFQLCFGLFLLANLLFNYIRCCKTDPGGTEVLLNGPVSALTALCNASQTCANCEVSPANLVQEYAHIARQCRRFCQTCRRPKPPLAHHCSICNRQAASASAF